MTESDIIIEYLSVIGRGEVVLYDHTFSAYMQTIKAHGLIIFEGKVPHISKEGYEVLKLGSFDKWLAAKEQKEAEIHKATIDTAKAAVDAANSAKWSQYAAIVAAIAAVVAIIIPLFTTENKPPEIRPDPVLSAMQSRLDRIDSLVKAQPKKPINPSSNKGQGLVKHNSH